MQFPTSDDHVFASLKSKIGTLVIRLAVNMDIHGYIHIWISDISHCVYIFMDIMLAHLLIKLTYMLCLSLMFLCLSFLLFILLLYLRC